MKLSQFSLSLRLLVYSGIGLIGYLFWVQNSSRLVPLSLDLQVAAWELAQPVAVSSVILGSFVLGAVFAFILGLPNKMAQSKKLRDLERNRVFQANDADVSDASLGD